ncbi:MAG: molybdenum cofactor biosynthesis protein MoaE [Frankiales bacterium]|nr:molybdenum cofactor biosynthesis protein MoaE [Frankiales bacterium]
MTALVTDQVLDPAAFEAPLAASGAVVTFVGRVRDHDGGRAVVELEYSAHPSAQQVLEDIAAKLGQEALGLSVAHRVGTLRIGDVALVAVVATAHRAEAFDVCARLVEEVKHTLPVWKRQLFADGTDEWVGAC